MASSLVTQLMDGFRGDALDRIASMLGESPAQTHTALGAVLPALLGGLAGKASTSEGAGNLLDLIKAHGLDSGALADVSSAVSRADGVGGLMTAGQPLIENIFGGGSDAVADWVASVSGISRSSASSLLRIAMPIVLGAIARRVSRAGWSASSLMKELSDQTRFLRDAPAGLPAVLGLDETPSLRGAGYDAEAATRRAPVAAVHHTAHRSHAWRWALPMLLLIPLIGFLMSRQDQPRREAAVRTPEAPLTRGTAEPSAPVGTTGISPRLPAALGAYRLEFDTDSGELTAQSSERLREVVEVLKRNPKAKLLIAGYTDDSGSDAHNMKLSQDRADATLNRIVVLGIDRSRITARGHGASHPVADNTTTEGRHRNQRVEIRVIDR